MATFDLARFESQVQALIKLNYQLQDQVSGLQQELVSLQNERDQLYKHNTLAQTRIEEILTRLRTLEENL